MRITIVWRCPICNQLNLEYTGPGRSGGFWQRPGCNFFCGHPEKPTLGPPCSMEPIATEITALS